jgi:hypothetical protein
MLQAADILFTFVHIAIIAFNLFGWIWPSTRKAHLICILATAASWFILGIWFGIGYCPITDWQWQVKERLGETNLPGSFVKYVFDNMTGRSFSVDSINYITLASFGIAALLSVYTNFIMKREKQTNVFDIH